MSSSFESDARAFKRARETRRKQEQRQRQKDGAVIIQVEVAGAEQLRAALLADGILNPEDAGNPLAFKKAVESLLWLYQKRQLVLSQDGRDLRDPKLQSEIRKRSLKKDLEKAFGWPLSKDWDLDDDKDL